MQVMELISNSTNLSTVVNTIKNEFNDVPDDIILLEVLVKLSQIASLNRLSVRSIEAETFCNIYSVIFAESGIGKDKPLKFINKHLMGAYEAEFAMKANKYYSSKLEAVKADAEELYKDSRALKEQYKMQHAPRTLVTEIGNGTMEGLIDYRVSLQDAGFGGTFISISEFGDYITSNNNSRMEFLTLIQEIYDSGDSLGKVIKGNKRVDSVKGVPSTVHFHTSPHGLLEGFAASKLKQFLNRGLARRAFICYPDPVKLDAEVDLENAYDKYLNKKDNELLSQAKEIFDGLLMASKGKVMLFNEEANKALFYSMNLCKTLADLDRDKYDEAVTAEIRNRYWKALKLSGLIALIEHPRENVVTKDDWKIAMKISNHYGEHFKKFYESKEIDPVVKLYKYMNSNNSKEFTKMELRQKKFVSDRDFAGWFNNALSDLNTYAQYDGNRLIVTDSTNGTKLYSIGWSR